MWPFSKRNKTVKPNDRVLEFLECCDAVCDPKLAAVGFNPLRRWGRREFALAFFRRGEQYIVIGFSTHYRDGPEHCHIELGEGSDEFPEADWNAVALSQMSDDDREVPQAEPYTITKFGSIDAALKQLLSDLERDAADFLRGSLERFHAVRRESTRKREPYRISRPRSFSFGRRDETVEPISAALKERFSK